MTINHLIIGSYETNCYILRKEASAKDCVIIDTGLEGYDLLDFLHKNKFNPAAVILTHGHADHIVGLGDLKSKYPTIRVYIHKADASMLIDAEHNLSALAGVDFSTEPADIFLEDDQLIEAAGLKLLVLHTPGHTPGGICLYVKDENTLFTGDTLFCDSVGRTDFPGGSMDRLIDGIKEKLLTLPDDTTCCPGHGPKTTIGREKKYNQYLQ
ncbi:MAG: MBL fold metallo-hydrolase [Phycisphaerae bacterium]|nr:MBL fold metallo-hydrolase [Phycisphaerae bacterium]